MNKDFSQGFCNDIGDLLQACHDNKTDTVEIEMEVAGKLLTIELTFKISEKGD